ncbi:LPS-assembly protein LptD [Parvularcula lutaonensis]|uniref:LPS-assembly protein LptD n=1 Tax=Parvularcula lutaonensis TaxID=491923 RepID=A0ABV7MCG0_9PROT|nr:LPS assembly protein LptD [Parvularcula lutaonensis]GGY39087.1 LPS-assembly protein LptD [Parvularcula lutaonensis]
MLAAFLLLFSSAITVQAEPVETVREGDVLLEADRIYREFEDGPLIAEGDVRAASGAQFLRADRVVYDIAADTVTAQGNVAVRSEDGQLFFGEDVVLSSDLRNGIVAAFAAELPPNGTLGAATAIRRESGTNELRKATYTLCRVCDEGLRRDRPTWQLKARRVIQDENKKKLTFRDAFLEIYGVPAMYVPYVQVPDPSVDRASGFLAPQIGSSSVRGTEVEVPYYWAISDYQDFTFSPRHFELLGTQWKGEYRRNTWNSSAIVQAGIIKPTNDLSAEGGNPDNVRWHWFSKYRRELPAQWTLEADVDAVSDQGYLLIYDLEPDGELQEEIGILRPDRLESNLTFDRRTENSFTDVSAWLFQTLRVREDQAFTAQALPRIRHERYFDGLGGNFTLGGSFLTLLRDDGLDSMRGSGHLRYERVKLTRGGHRFETFGELRGDLYTYRDADLGTQACNVDDRAYDACRMMFPRGGNEESFSVSRFLPTVGAEWSYPLARIGENASFIIEPRVQAVVSPDESFADDVFNEDSQFFQFDTVTLFDYNKATGLDLWEGGQRVNAGVSTTATFGQGVTVNTLVGGQFRAKSSDAFNDNTGIGEVQSDIVGAVDVNLGSNFAIDNRFRIDDDTGSFRRVESLVRGRLGRLSGRLNYLRIESDDFETDQVLDEFLVVSAALKVTKNINLAYSQAQNLDSGSTTNTQLALRLANRCAGMTILYRFDDSTVPGFQQDRELLFRVQVLGFN